MEELHIKCPSCGIILEVRNSKNEAVKRIICPNCKKQLAVTFREQPSSSQYVDIKKVQLTDGSIKTVVRVLTSDHVVKINGKVLQKGDEVVLRDSDKLQVDKHDKSTTNLTPPAAPKSSKDYRWLYAAALFIACLLTFFILRQTHLPKQETKVGNADTITVVPPKPVEKSQPTPAEKPKSQPEQKKVKLRQKPQPSANIATLNSYELEQLAIDGSIDAQCLLGKRWVQKKDSVSVVKGIQYLKLAAKNGSSEARSALQTVYASLQQSAALGNSKAANILREQRYDK